MNGLLRDYFPKGTDLSAHRRRAARGASPGDQPPPPQDARLEPAGRPLPERARRRLNAWARRPPRAQVQDPRCRVTTDIASRHRRASVLPSGGRTRRGETADSALRASPDRLTPPHLASTPPCGLRSGRSVATFAGILTSTVGPLQVTTPTMLMALRIDASGGLIRLACARTTRPSSTRSRRCRSGATTATPRTGACPLAASTCEASAE